MNDDLKECLLQNCEERVKLFESFYKIERASAESWRYLSFISWLVVAWLLVVLYDCKFGG